MPDKQKNNAAKFAFFYILSLVSLIFVALASGMVLFQVINKEIVDIINEYSGRYSDSQMRFAISALVIATPIFYITMRQIYRNLHQGYLDKDSDVRKWLTYLILLVSILVMIGWLIATLNSFLGGELTVKSILKASTALLISGAIFSFFFYDIKRNEVLGRKDRVIYNFFWASLIFVAGIFVLALLTIDSPQQARNKKIDQEVLNDFYQIDSGLNNYYQEKGELPKSLAELQAEFSYILDENLRHPDNQQPYTYEALGEREYQLCTNFLSSNIIDNTSRRSPYGFVDKRWLHQSGYNCIKQKIEQKILPVPID